MNLKGRKYIGAAVSLVFWTATGLIIGLMTSNIGLGIALGASFGLIFGPAIALKEKKTN